ncbi:MAG: ribose 5-phosphate isomerase B [Desulfobacterales bacterium]|nr:ribose 5-phosphate isomerase B [Desulfobacterales bacterium]
MSETEKTIIIGCDHAAFPLKECVKRFVEEQGLDVTDVGAFNEESVDYPDIGIKVASRISKGEFPRGILLCGTGIGMSLVANRFAGVRATLCQDIFSALMSRRHNDSNILVLGGRVIGDVLAMEIVRAWLETPFEGDRHQRRLDMFNNLGADAS